MKMKNKVSIGIVLLFIFACIGTIVSSHYMYVQNHVMEYEPSSDEMVGVADEYGIILDDSITISAVLLDYTYPNKETAYSIKVEGAEDAYSFLTDNVNVDGNVTLEEGVVLIDGVPIPTNETVSNYERDETYTGGSISVLIWGGHNASNENEPYKVRVTFTFFYENDVLSFIEVGAHCYPFGDECCGQIRREHFWEDYFFYPLFPIFK